MQPLATIGYEGSTQGEVIARLKAHGVELLLDVRAVASSRKAGFSKTLLSAGLEEAGVAYLHLRDLGTPKEGRQAARAGRTGEMRRIFQNHMETEASQAALGVALEAAARRRTCLLCFEREHHECHRAILADMMSGRSGARVEHL